MEHRVFLSHSSENKLIAEAICNHLESNSIRCWIAPRDIDSTDWALSIMTGLHQCDVFVVIISHDSINSPEVTKEVVQATQFCRYILPFRVDQEELNERMRYHLGPCHWLDAVDPPLEKRIAELEERIRQLTPDDAVYVNQNQRRLLERVVWPRNLFVGREAEIDQIADHLREEHLLFLQGMGGIGKSEIAKAYAKQYRDRYDTIIFAGYEGSLRETVSGNAIPIENLHRGSAETESSEEFFFRKLGILKELATERTLLIIDNFDTDTDPDLEEFVNGPYHLIFTTRNEFEDYPMLRVGRIRDFELVRQIFAANYGKSISPGDMAVVDQILKLVNCHTITVELIAKQMKASHRKPAQMLQMLQNTGINTKLKEKIRHSGTDQALSAFDYIRQMFQLSGLNEAEKQILRCMCMIPHTGIDISDFSDWCGLESYDDINSLLTKSWLILDEDTDVLSLHPVICDVVKAELKPSPGSTREYICGFWEYARNCWYMPAEERDALKPYVAHIQNHYPQPAPELWLQYADFVNIAWMCGDFERSQRSGHIFYDFCLRHFGPASEKTGKAALFLAGSYHNADDNDSAGPYYQLALEHYLAHPEPDRHQIAVVHSKLGRCAYYRGDYDKARDHLEQALELFRTLAEEATDPGEKKIRTFYSGDTVVEFARMYMAMGDYETALKYARESYDIFLLREGREVPNNAYSLVDMGICLSKLGRCGEARQHLERALELNTRFNGPISLLTIRTREAIADNILAMGDSAAAREQYLQLELDMERYFGANNPQVIVFRSKRSALEGSL